MTITRADSKLAYRIVPTASSEAGPRPGGLRDIRGVVIHMAEGGGTVSWLTRPDGNSSHYVVDYSGRITQMVRESWWAGSINPRKLRTTNDAAFTFEGERIRYGWTAAERALGAAARDPNRYVIAIETEGFAGKAPVKGRPGYDARANPDGGPNDRQRDALRALVADIRHRRGALPALGHRDFQSYKACPGKRIPWRDYGGHAVSTTGPALPDTGTEDPTTMTYPVPTVPHIGTVAKGAWLYVDASLTPNASNIQIDPARDMPYLGAPATGVRIVQYINAQGEPSGKAYYCKGSDLTNVRPLTLSGGASEADLEAAQAALERAQADNAELQAELDATAEQLAAAQAAWRSLTGALGE